MYISEPLQKVASLVRVSGSVVAFVGVLIVILLGLEALKEMQIDRIWVVELAAGCMTTLLGLACIVLGGRLRDGAFWAYYPLLGMSIIIAGIGVPFSRARACLPLYLLLFGPLAACLNAWREVRFRERSRRKRARGFEPLMPSYLLQASMVVPPRPAKPVETIPEITVQQDESHSTGSDHTPPA